MKLNNMSDKPFKVKPIDIANQEIKMLKKTILDLRKEIEFISKQVSTLTEDLLKRKKIEEAKDKECVVVENNSGWWW
jgi:hypothetical protein